MPLSVRRLLEVLPAVVAWVALANDRGAAAEPPDFNRQIRPILADACWKCHGPDAHGRQAKLRLDARDGALAPAESGASAIVPEAPDRSELLRRIDSQDEQLRMPPASSGKSLTDDQRRLLREWIIAGAPYQTHWSFAPLTRPALPRGHASQDDELNPIDAFVAARFASEKLEFAAEAPASVLLRRVTLDLTGLPPTRDDQARAATESYEQAVDRLLASPAFGEHLAVSWLDAARYADTNGYFSDKPRQAWLWREWVIQALNRNLPFDQFTIEQLAGDLLPNPTVEQRIATGFNRNHMANNETGIIDEEFRVEYVADRVETAMATWTGLTIGCAQCHDHKYDPVSQREYYQLFAFFNNVPERGLITTDDPPPTLSVPTPEQERRLAELAQRRDAASRVYAPLRAAALQRIPAWEGTALGKLAPLPDTNLVWHEPFHETLAAPARAVGTSLQSIPGVRGTGAKFDATQHIEVDLRDWNTDSPWTIGFWARPEGSLGCPLAKIEPAGDRRGVEIVWQKGRLVIHLVHGWSSRAISVSTRNPVSNSDWHHVAVRYDGRQRAAGVSVFLDGQRAELDVLRDALDGATRNDQPLRIARRDEGLGYYGLLDELRIVSAALDDEMLAGWAGNERLRGLLEIPAERRSARNADDLLDLYLERSDETEARAARDQLRASTREEQRYRATVPVALVMEELATPRETRVLERGQYHRPAEVVAPGVPAALSPWPSDAPPNRLGLARWLVAPDQPLTARVAANRLWKQCFGEGLVRTPQDFGAQGEPPTHPELLDYLAATLRDEGWDVKRLLRLIVTSRTYRQSSRLRTVGGRTFDLENRWLARGPRYRLSAEMIRDQALAISGLLTRRLGGPSVKPRQPAGLWEEVSYNAEDSYEADLGEGLYRRSVYTFVKRQSPPPSLLLFDGPTREKCVLTRPRTNTPLQSLALLNDPTYLEAARALASDLLARPGADAERCNELAWRVLARPLTTAESVRLREFVAGRRQHFLARPEEARALAAVGKSGDVTQLPMEELAAWTLAAHSLLNLDEAISQR